MTTREPSLRHRALESAPGAPITEARLTDQQRLAILLQGAAFLAHLEHAGCYLPASWETAEVRDDMLTIERVERGRSNELPQALLMRLLRLLFRVEDEVQGRGEARRAARQLGERWRQVLIPYSLDQAVADIFECAPFLWENTFAQARTTLVAEHGDGDRAHLWVVGPGRYRRRFLATSRRRSQIEAMLRNYRAVEVWEGFDPDADPMELTQQRHYRRAVAFWRRQPPTTAAARLAYGRCFFALGRYSRVLAVLADEAGFEASLLRIKSQHALGKIDAALQAMRRLGEQEWSGRETLDLAEMAILLLPKRGLHEESREWRSRAYRAAQSVRGSDELYWRAELLAAQMAWDQSDHAAMETHLEEAREAADHPELARRWHETRALLGVGTRDGDAVVRHNTTVLRGRRRLLPVEAGRRWSDLAYGRLLLADLAGAERAMRHSARLLATAEGATSAALGDLNLAEIQLRRGRLGGVAETVEVSIAKDRLSGDFRALLSDLQLHTRLELVQGRPQAALASCRQAHRIIDEHNIEGCRDTFELFAARAHGWLGHREAAARRLERITDATFLEIEPEERPAIWALAGEAEKAAREAASTVWAELWTAHLAGIHPEPRVWQELHRLEPFRAARLIYDYEQLQPGTAPPEWTYRAARILRAVGAEDFADRIENRSLSPWRAVEHYLSQSMEPQVLESSKRLNVTEVFAAAGYRDVRLTFRRGDHEDVLVAGRGGGEVVTATHENGRLVLEAPTVDTVLRALFHLARRDVKPLPGPAPEAADTDSGMIGESEDFKETISRLDILASGELPVLILGESGTGKELAARRVHERSRRISGPFLAVNCAALSENLIQSDLFGHVRGAFTGANRDRPGIFESARSGTVFLDEIGDLPLPAQGKLLRVLQEGEIVRTGESLARKVDVRVIAATHRDLERMVESGEFRRDLFYRLNVATVTLPPLRKRGHDIIILAEYFLARIDRETPSPMALSTLSPVAKKRLLSHRWPGNVRELSNVLEVAATLAGGKIEGKHLDIRSTGQPDGGVGYHELVNRYRRRLVADALVEADGNRAAAARILGLSRQALSYLVRQFGLR